MEEKRKPGRPPRGPKYPVIITAAMEREAVEWLDRHCETLGINRSEALRKLIDHHRLNPPNPSAD